MKETAVLTAIALVLTIIAVIAGYYSFIHQSWLAMIGSAIGVMVGLLAAFTIAITHNDPYL
jgi:succinate-acetate transporter protein